VSTFGFIGPGKGVKYAINAISKVIKVFPNTVYLILGQTHPNLKKVEGESYREKLIKLTEDLGIENHVRFINHFLTLEELADYLSATDIYITPYPNKNQIVSGTLTYALGVGKAIVSTPYMYAIDVLSDNRGILVPFEDINAMANSICRLIADKELRHRLELRTEAYGRNLKWSKIGWSYTELLDNILVG